MGAMNRDKMVGRKCPEGPGGRDCPCCGQAPGTERKRKRRAVKRAERQRERERAAFWAMMAAEDELEG